MAINRYICTNSDVLTVEATPCQNKAIKDMKTLLQWLGRGEVALTLSDMPSLKLQRKKTDLNDDGTIILDLPSIP